MKLTGQHFIAGQRKANGDSTFTGVNPATGQKLPTVFHDATIAEIDQAATAAEEAFTRFKRSKEKSWQSSWRQLLPESKASAKYWFNKFNWKPDYLRDVVEVS